MDLTAIDGTSVPIHAGSPRQGTSPIARGLGGPVYTGRLRNRAGGPSLVDMTYLNQNQALYLGKASTIPAIPVLFMLCL